MIPANRLLDFIDSIRKTDKYIETIYMNGACYQFHLMLKRIVDCEPMINEDKNHVVSKLGEKLFDITGEVTGNYTIMSDSDILIAEKWSFHRTKMIQLGECLVCEEPIVT